MRDTNRITVNAGGRIFETTKDTLMTSGASYFAALFGETGSRLGSLNTAYNESLSDNENNANNGRGIKRSRTDEGSAKKDEIVKEVFVDRNPDLFSDVLDFMRSGRLPARSLRDVDRLQDLKAEADYFAYDALREACSAADNELRKVLSKALEPEPEPKAECMMIHFDADETGAPTDNIDIEVPKGKVLYLESATLAGRCVMYRYLPNDSDKEQAKKLEKEGKRPNVKGCYIASSFLEDDSGDFQLLAYRGNYLPTFVLSHVGLNQADLAMNMGQNIDFRQQLGLCLSPPDGEDTIRLYIKGTADWDVLCWLGDPCAIPGLQKSGPVAKKRKIMPYGAEGGAAAIGASTAVVNMTSMMAVTAGSAAVLLG